MINFLHKNWRKHKMENQITGRYIKWVVITFLGNRNYIDGPSEGCVWKNDLDCDLPGNGNARRVFFNAWKCDETEIFNDFSGKWILNQIKGLKLSHSIILSRNCDFNSMILTPKILSSYIQKFWNLSPQIKIISELNPLTN